MQLLPYFISVPFFFSFFFLLFYTYRSTFLGWRTDIFINPPPPQPCPQGNAVWRGRGGEGGNRVFFIFLFGENKMKKGAVTSL